MPLPSQPKELKLKMSIITTLTTTETQLEPTQQVRSAIFHLFPKLPTELRLKIWNILIPRAVTFHAGGGPPPAVLSVCRESRNETYKQYSTEFLRPLPFQVDIIRGAKSAVFINYDVDTFNISSVQSGARKRAAGLFLTAQQLYPGYLGKVKRIMVGVPMVLDSWGGFEQWWHFTPWKLIDTGRGRCKHVTFVFGGDESTLMAHLLDLQDERWASLDEKNIMAAIRESLEKSREEGYCRGLEVGFARDKRAGAWQGVED